jgi:hypothetical protein
MSELTHNRECRVRLCRDDETLQRRSRPQWLKDSTGPKLLFITLRLPSGPLTSLWPIPLICVDRLVMETVTEHDHAPVLNQDCSIKGPYLSYRSSMVCKESDRVLEGKYTAEVEGEEVAG